MKWKPSTSWSIILLVFFLPHHLFSQQSENRIDLEHADSLVGRNIDGENVRELIGHVRFRQGNVVVNCDHAVQHFQSNKVSLDGNVVVRDDTLTLRGKRGMYYNVDRIAEAYDGVELTDGRTVLTADFGQYFAKDKRAFFRTNVRVQDSVSTLTSDELTYFRAEQQSIAVGNVKVVSSQDNITLYGQFLDHDRKSGFTRMAQQPRAVQIDTARDGSLDTLIVLSRIMESYRDSLRRLVAIDSVRLWRKSLAATARLGFFLTELDSIILRGEPIVWYEENQISGDSIFLKLEKRKLRTVYVRGDAFAISVSDSLFPSRFDQMSGEEITMSVAGDKIQRIDVERTASSLYFLYEDVIDSAGRRKEPNGLNKTTGDRVIVEFVDGKSDKIRVLGGVEGEYYPEVLVEGKESEYNLTGFNWREDRPGKRILQSAKHTGSKSSSKKEPPLHE